MLNDGQNGFVTFTAEKMVLTMELGTRANSSVFKGCVVTALKI